MRKYFILCFLLIITFTSYAQDPYKVKLFSKNDVFKLTRVCSIDRKINDSTYMVYATDEEFEQVQYLAKEIEYFPESIPVEQITMAPSSEKLLEEWSFYPTFPQYIEIMQNFEKTYPYLCRLDTIGYSVRGKPLLVLQIAPQLVGKKVVQSKASYSNKPNFMYISSMHGNELVGYVLMLQLIDYLLKYYATDNAEGARVSRILDNINVFIMPLMNPDGAYRSSDTTVVGARRGNANGKDLNRNFPCQYTNPENTTVGKEPETVAVMEFTQKHTIHLSANFHTGAVVVNYPYDAMPDGSTKAGINNCPDSIWFKEVSLVYALKNPDMANSTSFENGVTLGTAWYPIYGGMQDWKYVYAKGREVTIELALAGIPAASTLPTYWEKNKESLLAYMEQAMYGITGKVIDEEGNAVRAKIRLLEIPENEVYSNDAGYFWRYVSTGLYNLEVSADGFLTDTIKNVFAKFDSTSYIEVTLKKEVNYTQDLFNNNKFVIYPNPCEDYISFEFNDVEDLSNIEYTIIDIAGKTVKRTEHLPKPVNKKHSIDLMGLGNGVYFLFFDINNKKSIY